MKKLLLFLTLFSNVCIGQSLTEETEDFRNNYIAEHLAEKRSPIKYRNVKDLDFYTPRKKFQVVADVKRVQDDIGFDMLTHSGKKKHYYKYAILTFNLNRSTHTLLLYQSGRLREQEEYKDYLFLPFTDATNYKSTFGGGRYIDFVIDDIEDDKLVIDFNKCYNPYCAYAGGFSCPIPPKENRLDIAIKAGEKLFKDEPVTHK